MKSFKSVITWLPKKAFVLALSFILGSLFGDSPLIFFSIGGWFLLAAIIVTPIFAAYLVWFLCNRHYARYPVEALIQWLFVFSVAGSFLWGGAAKSDRESETAERFVATSIPTLEAIKSRSKRYPEQLPDELAHNKPELISYDCSPGGTSYSFSYFPPLMVMGRRIYYSAVGERTNES